MVKLGETAAEVYGVSADFDNSRCPRCAALVRPGSQWCTLCYADLRPAPPAPAPAVEPAAELAAEQAAYSEHPTHTEHAFDPLTAPLAVLDREPDAGLGARGLSDATDLAEAQPAGKHAAPAVEPELGWPCATCGATVPFEEGSCIACGAGFLENVDADTSLHRFGLHTGQVSTQTKAFIMVGGSFGLLVLLLGIMYLLGTVL